MLKSNFTTLVAIALTSIFMAAPAAAQTPSEDVQSCREAMRMQDEVDMSTHRLRFEKIKGNSKGRTLTLKVISNRGEGSFTVQCELDKTRVVAVKSANKVMYAAKPQVKS